MRKKRGEVSTKIASSHVRKAPKRSSSPRKDKAKSKPTKRKYEGASKSKRLSRWIAGNASANSEIQNSLITLRNRARDLRRNNPYASKGIQVITSNIVGDGIQTQFRGTNVVEIEKQWKAWACSTAIDFDGRQNLYGLQRLIMDAVAESGEVLVRKRYNAAFNFPLQYQVLESDFLDVNKNETINGNTVIQGIEFDSQGRRVAYWLFENHPGGYDSTALVFQSASNRIPADEIRHVFRQDRPGQARGIPWLAPVIVRLKDLDDFEDAQLVRQKVAACFTAFIRDISADFSGDVGDEAEESDLSDMLSPGTIEHLPAGKTIEFSKPPELAFYQQFVTANLHAISSGMGITYESLSGDLSMVNFSSARMGWIEMGRNFRAWREHVMIAHCLDPITLDFLQMCALKGMRVDGVTSVHVAPAREMIDPGKEMSASIDAIRSGMSTLSEELMSKGKDPEEHLTQYAEDMKLLDKLDLKLESDPRNWKEKTSTNTQVESNNGGNNESTQNQNSATSNPGGVQARVIRRKEKHNRLDLDDWRTG